MDSRLPEFPADWQRALVLVAHPDDPEYGMATAISRWTREGKRVDYVLATSGEAGIDGMEPAVCGPLREEEQRRAGAVVGVTDITFLGFPDSELRNDESLRSALGKEIRDRRPDVVLSLYRGPAWGPEAPNQRDHIEFGNAAVAATADLPAEERPRWLFENGPGSTHRVAVTEEDVQRAIGSLAEHDVYLQVLDPDTPVAEQARKQVEMTCQRDEDGGIWVGFTRVDL
ncbi:PIG-L deacetylase family protein [Enemella evansiae]|uniref:PIG-L deacetylase family protein n=1 Tax=Enemella evansiae TaxID=2016499 RepID=UPI000B9708DE|nr:PIG-L family deacetylase [Enemella evansiae]OYO07758.1 PIG-L family deacetylase [Enemella evansiae]TDO86022.1 GlcNAc-PI de-N-acetylase [Enemella evansiae]